MNPLVTHAVLVIALAQIAAAQSASTEIAPDALTVRASRYGSCQFLEASVPCERIGAYLLKRNATPGLHVHIEVDPGSRYELVAATLKSFEGTGFNVGFANNATPARPILISEIGDVGYGNVADALKAISARRILSIPGVNGAVSFAEPDQKTTWTFVGKQNPAYPSVVRYVFETMSEPAPHVQIAVLCEASSSACERFRRDTRRELVKPLELMAMLADDPAAKCQVFDETIQCGVQPTRVHTDQQVYVQMKPDGTCAVDGVETACLEIGKAIRNNHPSDDPKISVCAARNLTYEAVGSALGSLGREGLPLAFGCPPR